MTNDRHTAEQSADRLSRALLSLDGLSVGDAFGQCFFAGDQFVTSRRIASDDIPPAPWQYTDDTEMAIVLVDHLRQRSHIDQDELARAFADRYMQEPWRGYGGMAKTILTSIYAGDPWKEVSSGAFDGAGSMGNGSAMRVAPLGAYFAGDLALLVKQARLSAQVTHFHREGEAGAIAVALAAAFAVNHRGQHSPALIRKFFEFILRYTPESVTREGIAQAMELPRSSDIREAMRLLGNGSRVTCPDTVPFCLWMGARHFNDYRQALWMTAAAGGDIDTNCAIVGGIVSLACADPLPARWLAARGGLNMPNEGGSIE